jgi:elongation factor Ts
VAISISADHKTAAIVEVNSETDFVARNEKFQDLVIKIAELALINDDVLNAKITDNETTKEFIDHLIAIVGENITFRRTKRITVNSGVIASYIHGTVAPGMGKIGVLVALEAKNTFDISVLTDFGKKIAMHIAAANPLYLCSKCIPPADLEKERNIAKTRAQELGKPDAIIEKMVDGHVKKFLAENTLMEQIFVIDGKTKVFEIIDAFNKKTGSDVKVYAFEKFVLGEGIDKPVTSFAEEVAAFTK